MNLDRIQVNLKDGSLSLGEDKMSQNEDGTWGVPVMKPVLDGINELAVNQDHATALDTFAHITWDRSLTDDELKAIVKMAMDHWMIFPELPDEPIIKENTNET